MKKNTYTALFAFLFILSGIQPVLCASSGWLTVDYAMLLSFHPRMAWFDFGTQRFYRGDIPLGDAKAMSKLQTKASEVEANTRAETLAVTKKRNILLKEINDAETTYKNEVNKALKENKDVSSMKKAYERRKAERLARLEAFDKDYQKITEQSLSVFYLSKEESSRYMLTIMSEIDAILKQISREHGNAAIMDRSYLAPSTNNFVPPPAIPGFSSLGAQLYAQLLQTDFDVNKNSQESQVPPDHYKNISGGIEEGFQNKLEELLTQIPSLRPVISNIRPNLFLVGGEDVTVQALQEIFKKNKIHEEAAKRIIQILPYLQ